jgi:hypothetical protein
MPININNKWLQYLFKERLIKIQYNERKDFNIT